FSGGTGGWGEAAEHFRWLSVRSLTLASGFHWLELQAVSDASNTNIDGILVTGSDAAPPELNEALAFLRPLLTGNAIGGLGYIWIEGEDWSEQNGSTGVDTKPAAVGGQVLGMNWGGGADHWATWEFELSPPGLSNAIACIRYCRLMPGDVEFSVAIDGQPAGDGKVKFSGGTGGWGEAPEHFRVAEVALGDLKPGKHRLRLAAQRDGSNVNIDGIFVAGGGFPRELSPEEEARLAKVYYASSQVAAEPQMRKVTLAEMPPGRPASTISVAEIVGELPPGAQRVVQKLATKPWPNLVAAYDVSPTDYNNDLTWLDLMKEKHFALPHAGRLGLVQPHTDIYVLQEISVVGRETQLQWRPVLHIANALTYRADLDGRSFVELTFLVRDSRTLIGRLLLHNAAGEPLVLRVATTIDHPVDGLPPQRFSRLIPCRTGRLAWASVEEARATAMLCCDEYLPGTSRPTGQVAVCLVGEGKPRAIGFSDKPGGELGRQPGRCCAMVHELTAAPRDRATFRFATSFVFFNERRQVDGPRGTVTYSRMSAEDAARSAYAQAHTALSEDFAQFLARSLDWYSSVPVLDLPHPTWERDFYASLELPRCETLSPHGN
ncbi:MAG: hypothetical protein H5T86_14585, partial [Armatimonadetes bacterium]|nr:hypothetical protein [Armatimonadota bacterium]